MSYPYTRGYDRVIIDAKHLAGQGNMSDDDLLLALSHVLNRSVDDLRNRMEYLSTLDDLQIKRIRHSRYPGTIDWESLFVFISGRDWDLLKSSSNTRDNTWVKFDPLEDELLLYHLSKNPSLQDAIDQLGHTFPHRLKRNWRSRYALIKSKCSPQELVSRVTMAAMEYSPDQTFVYLQERFPSYYSSKDTRQHFDNENDREHDEGDGPKVMFSSAEDKFIVDTDALFASKNVPDSLLLKILEYVFSLDPHTIRKHLSELRQESEMVSLALKEAVKLENVNWAKFEQAVANLSSDSVSSDIKWTKILAAISSQLSDFSVEEDNCLLAHMEMAVTIFDGARAAHRKFPHKSLQQWHKRYYVLLSEKGNLFKEVCQASIDFNESECEALFLERFPDVYHSVDGKIRIIGEDAAEPELEPVAPTIPRPPPTNADTYDTSPFTRTQDKVIYAANKTATENNVTIEVLVQTVSYVLNRHPDSVRQRLAVITTEMSADEITRLQRHNYPYGIDWHQIKAFLISAKSKPKEAVDWDELYTRSRAFNVKKRLDDKERKALLYIANSEENLASAMATLHKLYPHRSRHAWSDSLRILRSKTNYEDEVRAALRDYDPVLYRDHFTQMFPEYYGAKEVVRTVVDNNHNPRGKPKTEGSRYPLKPLGYRKRQREARQQLEATHQQLEAIGAPDEPNASSDKTLPREAPTKVKKPRRKLSKVQRGEAEQLLAEDLIRTVVQDAVDDGIVDPKDPAAADGLRPRKKRRAAAQIGSLAEVDLDEHDEQEQAQIESEASTDLSMHMNLSIDNEQELMKVVQHATRRVEESTAGGGLDITLVDGNLLVEPNVVDVAVAAAAMRAPEGGLVEDSAPAAKVEDEAYEPDDYEEDDDDETDYGR